MEVEFNWVRGGYNRTFSRALWQAVPDFNKLLYSLGSQGDKEKYGTLSMHFLFRAGRYQINIHVMTLGSTV